MHAESGLMGLDIDCAREMFARAFNRQGGIIGVIGPQNDIASPNFHNFESRDLAQGAD